ncbi:MAG TPA: D-hexose-6-phosphate mutarotase [Verrucomicrobiae bacterium]|jgi:D-hexose-6-phosphate mutarotase|nr:D-hexose-6-phosphate mutarotase [Verrucomicrobiae bacterium]
MATKEWQKSLEIPGRVLFAEGNGDLHKLVIDTPWSTAEIYLHGAQVTNFQVKGQPPVLFMSQFSRFAEGKAIRGGIPIIFPWFGSREGESAHGFARLQTWDCREFSQAASGEVVVRLSLPDSPSAALFPKFTADFWLTVGKTLTAQLVITNVSDGQDFTFEDCLHSYFHVGDIAAVSITGLNGIDYLNQTEHFARKTERGEEIKISQETDRIYLNTAGPVEIHDSKLGRRIRIEKTGSQSTVVWNPWVKKSEQMPDFGGEEFRQMVCVESGNVADNRLTLPAGKSNTLKVEISTLPL